MPANVGRYLLRRKDSANFPSIFEMGVVDHALPTTQNRKKNIGQIDSEFHETNNVLIFRQLLNISPSTFFARNLEKFREKNGNLFYYVHIVLLLLFRYWCRCGHSEYRQIFEGIFYVGQIPQCGTDPAILRAFSSIYIYLNNKSKKCVRLSVRLSVCLSVIHYTENGNSYRPNSF